VQIVFAFLIFMSMVVHAGDNHQALEKALDALVEKRKSPGFQYLIFSKDSILFSHYNGMATIADDCKVAPQTVFKGFSITKTMTAVVILQLVEEGKIAIDATLSEYIDSDFPDVTIRQLLSHTAGVPNPMPLEWIHLQSEHAGFTEDVFIDSVLAANARPDADPGEEYAYSNLGYLMLGQVVEEVTGMSYSRAVETRIAGQLPLMERDYLGFSMENSHTYATGYINRWRMINWILGFLIDKDKYVHKSVDGWKAFKPFYINGKAYGGIMANGRALMHYLQALMQNKLLSSDMFREMTTPQQITSGKSTEMALGWFVGELNGHQYVCHAGGGGGFYCEIRIYPYLGLGSVIMTNRTGVSDDRLLDDFDILSLPQ
jgi:D-alanyl-D-alanine carboxypeptidase